MLLDRQTDLLVWTRLSIRCLLVRMNRVFGIVLYATSGVVCDSKDLATPRFPECVQIRRTIGSIADRRQCCPSPYYRSVDLAIVQFSRGRE